ncbi:MAG: N(G),N(G)-dimethylarginine dimethylaminohydrolase [Balneolaceae bacterium]|nr:N(G),N(G)-dimethylarginine dimethylaminohydrolase [Balneolaceae bacterium]
MFTKTLLRKPCPNLVNGITEAKLGTPDYHKALLQHNRYADTLRRLGLEVRILEADNRFPDSVFVEDVAVCTSKMAIITRPGAASRSGETAAIKNTLHSYFNQLESIAPGGTLDGGDVMMVGAHFYIGLSDRTNEEGANQFLNILRKYDMDGTKVTMNDMLHLKTGVSYLENNTLLVSGEFVGHPAFEPFDTITIPPEEAYAANALWINGTVLIAAGYPAAQEKIEAAGYNTIEVEMSEFQKLDGGLSCLSLRF